MSIDEDVIVKDIALTTKYRFSHVEKISRLEATRHALRIRV